MTETTDQGPDVAGPSTTLLLWVAVLLLLLTAIALYLREQRRAPAASRSPRPRAPQPPPPPISQADFNSDPVLAELHIAAAQEAEASRRGQVLDAGAGGAEGVTDGSDV